MRNRCLLALAVFLLWSPSGCSDNPSGPDVGTGLPIVPIAAGPNSGFDDARFEVLRNQAGLLEVWSRLYPDGVPAPPEIDFEESMLLFVTLGTRSTAGYSVGIESVNEVDGTLHVTVVEEAPGDDPVPPVLTSPYSLDLVPFRPGPVEFSHRMGHRTRLQLEVVLPSYYFDPSETVPVTLRLRNRGSRPVAVQLPSPQVFDVILFAAGRPIWTWGADKRFPAVLTSLRILPGETREFRTEWHGEGAPAGVTEFAVIGTVGNAAAPYLRSKPVFFSRLGGDRSEIRRAVLEYFDEVADTRDVFLPESLEILFIRRGESPGHVIASVRFRTSGMGHPDFLLEALQWHDAEARLEPDPRLCPTCGGLWVRQAVCDHGGRIEGPGDWYYPLRRHETYDFGPDPDHPVCPHADAVSHADASLAGNVVHDWPDNLLVTLYCDDEDLYFTTGATIVGPFEDGPFLGRPPLIRRP